MLTSTLASQISLAVGVPRATAVPVGDAHASVLSAGAEMTLADAAKALGNQDEKVRSEATRLLKEGGWRSLAILDKLETRDPESLTRMRVIREFVSLGLHLEGSPELHEVVLNLPNLTPAEGQNSLRHFLEELQG